MNKQRRKKLIEISSKLEMIKSELEDCLNEEEDYYDNIPEKLQSSLRSEIAENVIDNMQNATDNLDEIINLLNETIENIDDATV